MTVFTAGAWWRDSDPHTFVIATSARKAKAAIRRAIDEEARSAAGNDDGPCSHCQRGKAGDHISCGLEAQAWSGVHPDSLRSILTGMRSTVDDGARGRAQRAELVQDLRADGVAYGETF